jgi:CheY-like chemotaxis protein
MSRPTILTVDDDPQVSAALTRDLKRQYGSTYRVLSATSAAQAVELLSALALRTDPVALIVSDQRMPEKTGIELLGESQTLAPEAKRLLLTAYADTDVAIAAINDIGLDYYLLKPWDPPEDRLFPVIDDLLGDWRRSHPEVTHDIQVVGDRWSDRTHELKTFLARNHVPYRWYDVERDEEGGRLFQLAGGVRTDLPLVLVPDREPLRSPTLLEAAGALGLHVEAEQPLYDVCIVGGGPAGLAAGVYAASEGLSTIILEREAPGGQAGQSSAIENYLGFPKGLSGSDLAQRALAQVSRFGAELVLAREVVGLEQRGTVRAVLLAGGGGGRGAVGGRLHRCLLPPPGGRRSGAAPGQGHLLRRDRGRGRPDRRRHGLHRRRRELRRSGRAELRPARQAGDARRPRVRPAGHDVDVPRGPDHVRREHHGPLRDGGRRRRGRRPPRAVDARRAWFGTARGGRGVVAVRLHRRVSAHRLAG